MVNSRCFAGDYSSIIPLRQTAGAADADVSSRIARRLGIVRDDTSQLCCDNDVARAQIKAEADSLRPAQTESETIALTVLEAAHALQRKIGKTKLADILKGSLAQDIEPFVKSPYYGKLAGVRRKELTRSSQIRLAHRHTLPECQRCKTSHNAPKLLLAARRY